MAVVTTDAGNAKALVFMQLFLKRLAFISCGVAGMTL
jgi:hypothetical protein